MLLALSGCTGSTHAIAAPGTYLSITFNVVRHYKLQMLSRLVTFIDIVTCGVVTVTLICDIVTFIQSFWLHIPSSRECVRSTQAHSWWRFSNNSTCEWIQEWIPHWYLPMLVLDPIWRMRHLGNAISFPAVNINISMSDRDPRFYPNEWIWSIP